MLFFNVILFMQRIRQRSFRRSRGIDLLHLSLLHHIGVILHRAQIARHGLKARVIYFMTMVGWNQEVILRLLEGYMLGRRSCMKKWRYILFMHYLNFISVEISLPLINILQLNFIQLLPTPFTMFCKMPPFLLLDTG